MMHASLEVHKFSGQPLPAAKTGKAAPKLPYAPASPPLRLAPSLRLLRLLSALDTLGRLPSPKAHDAWQQHDAKHPCTSNPFGCSIMQLQLPVRATIVSPTNFSCNQEQQKKSLAPVFVVETLFGICNYYLIKFMQNRPLKDKKQCECNYISSKQTHL